jgi:uncharacterized membrane protein
VGKQLFVLQQITGVLWLRASLFGLSAVAAVLLAHELGGLVPPRLVSAVSDDAAKELLSIIASSMLAVATFSLATLVAAAGAVTSNASPRAAALLLDDRSAQNALSAFIGAFIFSIVGLIAVGSDFYDSASLFVLFVVTLAVLAYVVVRLLGWMDQLSKVGRVGHAIDHVETVTRKALKHRRAFLGGVADGDVPPHAKPVCARKVGYVQHVDVPHLNELARTHDLVVHLAALPGAFLPLSRPALYVEGEFDDHTGERLVKAVVIGGDRTFRQDPRFGLVVLAEIASRALSPALNDPGTAIDVIGTAVRLLSVWAEEHWEERPREKHSRVLVPPLSARDIFEDVFRPIARDGAGMVEVGVALQKAFSDLAHAKAEGFAQAARDHSSAALRRAEAVLVLEEEKDELRRLAAAVARVRDKP